MQHQPVALLCAYTFAEIRFAKLKLDFEISVKNRIETRFLKVNRAERNTAFRIIDSKRS